MTLTIPFEENYVTSSDGLSLYYRDYNSSATATPIVCLPGLTRNARDFEEIAPRLAAEGWRVLAPDLRGRGHSDYDSNPANYIPTKYVDDTLRFLDDLDLESISIIGTSLGGLMAMIIASVAPERLQSVILNDVGPEIEPTGLEHIRSYVGKSVPRQTWREVVLAFSVTNAHIYPNLPEHMWEVLARRTHREMPSGDIVADYDPKIASAFAGAEGVQPAQDLWPQFAALGQIPTLAFRGELSDILSVKTFKDMQTQHPKIVAVTVHDRGHVPLLDEPECKAAIMKFLGDI